jgi:hypothetical protein
MHSDITEEAQSIRLVAAFLMLTGKSQGALSQGLRLFQVAGQQMCLSQGETTERLKAYHFHSSGLFHRLRE